MHLRPTGLALVAAALAVPLIFIVPMASQHPVAAVFSQYLGICALIVMAIAQIIATRLPGVEQIFGGMDRGYILHKWLGIGALVTMFLHESIGAEIKGLGQQSALNDLAESIGEFAYNGIIVLIIITIATFIPYHLWKWTHKLMGAFFTLGAVHYILILKPFSNFDPLGLYVGCICVLGVFAYLYRLVPARFRPDSKYHVQSVETSGDASVITLSPKSGGLRHRAGQFAFFSFDAAGMKEPHPFTISQAPDEARNLRITVRGLGDFTKSMAKKIQDGTDVRVEGPFGRFSTSSKKHRQVWIAGGIGITPFVALAQKLGDGSPQTELFYSVRDRDQAPHIAELEAIAASHENFTVHLVETAKNGRLAPSQIARVLGDDLRKAHVYFCGPAAMRNALIDGLGDLGVPKRRFHFEEFEIRTGVGLGRLLKWIWSRNFIQSRVSGRVKP